MATVVAQHLVSAGSASAAVAAPPDAWASPLGPVGGAATNDGEHVITSATASRLAPAWRVRPPTSYAYGGQTAPTIAGGVVYTAYNGGNTHERGLLVATSARTGARLWSVLLPANPTFLGRSYTRGLVVTGSLVLLPYDGDHQPAGVVAVSTVTRKVAWVRARPVSSPPSEIDEQDGPLVVDAGRAYVLGGESAVTAFRVSDGAVLWNRRPADAVSGIAAAGAFLYVTSQTGGLVAYDGATGVRRWSSPFGHGQALVAGGRVFAATPDGLSAYAASGCGASSCRPLWTRPVPNAAAWSVGVGGATGTTVFVTATVFTPSFYAGKLLRLSASTGAVQWSSTTAPFLNYPVRVANTVWVIANGDTLLGWSASATQAAPLRSLKEAVDAQGIVQGIAGASGTLMVQKWPDLLTGYRVPGT